MSNLTEQEEQLLIWDYYKPRHTHAWNMLVISWRELDQLNTETDLDFETEYFWENIVIRLWLYRTTVRTLTNLATVEDEAKNVLKNFDSVFDTNGQNALKAFRDMIEHFDDYASGKGRGPAKRENDLDPWRVVTQDEYQRGQFLLDRQKTYDAAIKLRSDAKYLSKKFIQRYKSS